MENFMKMLVVDDEYCVGMGITQTIDWVDYGIEVVGIAYNGLEALAKIEEYSPHIVITDIRMPLMNGLELVEKVRSHNQKIEFIILSGYDEFEYAKTALNLDVAGYLLKPIDNEELIEMVCKVKEKIINTNKMLEVYEEVVGENSGYRQQFLIDVIGGKYGSELISNKVSLYKLNPVFKYYFVVAMEFQQLKEDLTGELIENIVERIKKSNQLDKDEVIELKLDSQKFCFIVSGINAVGTIVQQIEQSIFDSMLKYKFIRNCNMKLGASTIYRVSTDLYKAYQEALEISKQYKGFESKNEYIIKGYCSSRKEIKITLDYIKENMAHKIKINDVADTLYMSPSRLAHLFKAETGITFTDAIIIIRMEAAEYYLRNLKYKVYDVSELVGYTDVKHFTKTFKKFTGISPGKYALEQQ